MKKLYIVLVVMLFLIAVAGFQKAPEVLTATPTSEALSEAPEPSVEPEEEIHTDYMAEMIQAAVAGDRESGLAAEALRNAKITEHALDYEQVSFEDMYLLAKIIYAEAGSNWLSDEWKLCVGEVVLNRVASPEFPDTVSEVIYQKGQYYGSGSTYFESLLPDERCVLLAKRLLEGERVMNDKTVVFQAEFVQGSGIHKQFDDCYLGTTYFCYSSYPELYN